MALMKVSFGGNPAAALLPEEVLACAWEVENDVYGFIVCGVFVGCCFFCV
jgi:hypothetical protein